jgi:hypothetical protein
MNKAQKKQLSGLTIAEILVSLAVASILSLTLSSLYLNLFKRNQQLSYNMDADTEENFANYTVSRDLENSMPSFLDTVVPDRCTRNFYDMYLNSCPDTAPSASPDCSNPCAREFKLSSANLGQTFLLITSDPSSPFAKPVAPMSAYTNPSNNTVAYSAVNFMQSLKNSAMLNNPFDPNPNQTRLKNNSIYVMYAANPVVDLNPNNPRLRYVRHFFQTRNVATNQLAEIITHLNGPSPAPLAAGSFPIRHPLAINSDVTAPNTRGNIDSIDKFFRTVPGIGGRGVLVFLRSVEILKYKLEPVNYSGRQTYQLVRSTFTYNPAAAPGQPVGWIERRRIVAKPIKSVTFKRDDVKNPGIRLVVEGDRI